MSAALWRKLNLADHERVFVIDAPKSFEAALRALTKRGRALAVRARSKS